MFRQAAAGLAAVLVCGAAYAGGTNYVVTAVNSTNNASALVVAADSAKAGRRVYIRPEADVYMAVGQAIPTNATALAGFPVVLANESLEFGADGAFADAVYARGTNSTATPKVNVIIIWR